VAASCAPGQAGMSDPGTVRALALAGTALHVGGRFDTVAGAETNSFATLDTEQRQLADLRRRRVRRGVDGQRARAGGRPPDGRRRGLVARSPRPAASPAWNVARRRATAVRDAVRGLGRRRDYERQARDGAQRWPTPADGCTWRAPSPPVGPLEAPALGRPRRDVLARCRRSSTTSCRLTPHGDGCPVGGDFDNAGPLRVQHLGCGPAGGWELLARAPLRLLQRR
jgi:hypothetical protein